MDKTKPSWVEGPRLRGRRFTKEREQNRKDKMEKAISTCADKIKAANPWDEALIFPQLSGSVKVVAKSGKFEFLVMSSGQLHELLNTEEQEESPPLSQIRPSATGDLDTEEQSYELFESLFEDLRPEVDWVNGEEARIAAAESAQWTRVNYPDERY